MKKIYYKNVDYFKIIFAILVVCVHTGPFLSISEEINFFLVQVLARCAVPFFFVSSAFFLFRKIDFTKSLQNEGNISVLKKYLLHIAKMYLFWTVIYFSIQLVLWYVNGFGITSILVYIRNFFFTGSYYHLWFLPGLFFSAFLIYVLLSKFDEKTVWGMVLVLYVLGMGINVYQEFLLSIPVLGRLVQLYLTLFETSRNGLFFGSVFVMMGCSLNRNRMQNAKGLMIGVVVSFMALVFEAYTLRKVGFMNDLTCMYFSLLPLLYCLYSLLLCYPSKDKGTIFLRYGSTLLYLIHCYFTFALQYVPIINGHSMLYFLATLFCSFGFIVIYIKVSEKIPFLRSVI